MTPLPWWRPGFDEYTYMSPIRGRIQAMFEEPAPNAVARHNVERVLATKGGPEPRERRRRPGELTPGAYLICRLETRRLLRRRLERGLLPAGMAAVRMAPLMRQLQSPTVGPQQAPAAGPAFLLGDMARQVLSGRMATIERGARPTTS